MVRFVLRRLGSGAVVMVSVTLTVFVVSRLIGDPVRLMLPVGASQEQQDAMRQSLGLDRPLLDQFLDYVTDILTLDFGTSIWQRVPAMGLVLDRLPATAQLVLSSVALALVLFVPLGMVAALRPGSLVDRALISVSLLGVSIPQFWLGAVLILVFSVQLGWLPTSGSGSWRHLVLPALTLALTSGGRIAQVARSSMIEQVNQPYVQASLLRGFSMGEVVRRQILRNALVPIITITAWEVAYATAGYAVVVETVFAWPGIGQLGIQAIDNRDLPLLQAVVFVGAALVVVVNVVADVLYRLVDPRLRTS